MLALSSNAHGIMASKLSCWWLQKFCHASSLKIHITGDLLPLNFGIVNPVDMVAMVAFIYVGVDTVRIITGGVTIVSAAECSVGDCELFSVDHVVFEIWFSVSG